MLDEANEIPGGDVPDNRLTTLLRVRRKVHLLRSNPDALYQLRKRIEQYKEEDQLNLPNERNTLQALPSMIAHNRFDDLG